MAKRSPRYPRHSLSKSLEMTKKLFAGAHQSKLDVDTAAKVIGYAGSGGGAASSALGALRQFGLVDGLRGDVAVSELAMRIIQPMDENERIDALREAAMKPEIFERILNQFAGKLPVADEPIRAFLIRQEGFSAGGANELIDTLRETILTLPERTVGPASEDLPANTSDGEGDTHPDTGRRDNPAALGQSSSSLPAGASSGELITLPLGQNAKAELRLIGDVSATSYARLIRHLELLRDMAAEEEQ